MRVSIGAALVLALVAAATLATGRWQGLWRDSWVGSWPGGPASGGDGAPPGPAGAAELTGRAALGPPAPLAVGEPGPSSPDRAAPDRSAPDPATPGRAEGPATLRLACDPSGPGLSAALTVPPLPGAARPPGAGAGGPGGSALPTGILVSGPDGVRSVRVAAGGAPADLADGATLTVAGARRDEDPLRGLVPGLTRPGARITWTQDGARRGDPVLRATFAVSDAEAASLTAALGGCLARPL